MNTQQQPFFFLEEVYASRWAWVVRFTFWFVFCWEGGAGWGLLTYYLLFFPIAVIYAKSVKNYFTLAPLLAETYVKVIPNFLNYSFAVLCCTTLSSYRSFLLPTTKINAYSPLTSRTLSIHLPRLLYEFASIWIIYVLVIS